MKHLLPVRFTRMMESPFAFFRGTAIVQAHDLSRTPSAGIAVQSCGDCHLMNFGGFASPERTLIFDINDFDETLPAPFEWDLKRLATSFVLATRWRKFGGGDARVAAEASLRAYRVKIAELANMTVLDAWYARVTFDDLMDQVRKDAQMRKRLSRIVRSANQRTSEAVFHKITQKVHGKPRIVDEPAGHCRVVRRVQEHAAARPPGTFRTLPIRRCRIQSCRCRVRGHPLLRDPLDGG